MLFFPFLQRPQLGIALAIVVGAVWLAWRSVALPVAFAAAPGIVVGLLGRNPFPTGTISILLFFWTILALVFAGVRWEALPLSSLLNAPALATFGLAVLLVVRLGASLDPAYGSVKVRLFIAQNLILLLAGIVIARRGRDLDLLFVWLLVFAALTAAVLAHGLTTGTVQANVGGRFSLDQQASPIGLGRDAARGMLVGAFLLLAIRATWLRLLALGTLPLIAVSFIAAGSRGPVLGLVVGGVVLLGLTLRDPRSRGRVLLVALAGIVGALLVSQLVPGQDVQRSLSILTGSGQGLSSNGRNDLWSQAWSLFTTHPLLGAGTGSFAGTQPVELFPHNLFLESGAELGILGALFVGAIFVGTGRALVLAWRSAPESERTTVAVVAALVVFAAVNAMVSSDITSNSSLWLAAGLAVGLAQRWREPAVAGARVLAMLPRRRERPARGQPRFALPERRGERPQRPAAPVERTPGRVLFPAAGETVGGIVEPLVEPARTGWGVAAVHLEWSADGETWHQAAPARELEISGVAGGLRRRLASTRSRALAALLVTATEASGAYERVAAEPLQRHLLEGGAWGFEWDTGGLADGQYVLRGATVDMAGARVPTPELRVVVSAAAATPALQPAQPSEAVMDERFARLAEQERAAAVRESELREREHAVARRESGLAEELTGVRDTEALVDVRATKLADLERELEQRVAGVTERERALAKRAAELGERERELEQRLDGITGRERALVRRAAALGSAEAPEQSPVVPPREPAVPPREPFVPRVVETPPEPERVVPPPPAPAALPVPTPIGSRADRLKLWNLDRLVSEQPHPDPYVQAEREATLFTLREFAGIDGTIPPEFHGLVYETLGDLLGPG